MNKARILITDDEVELCDILKKSLEILWDNYIIQTAYSSEDALSVMGKEDIDVLVTDIRMPGMDGIELMKKGKAIQKSLQTIVITGHGDMDSAIAALRLGVDNYLIKPVSAETLHFAIRKAWEKIMRKKAESRLQRSEWQYRTLAEKVADGIALIQNGRYLFVNEAFISMFGYTKSEQLVGKKTAEHIAADLTEPFPELHEAPASSSIVERVFTEKFKTEDGREFWAEARVNLIEWKGRPAVLSTVRDITQSKLREMEILEQTEYFRRENIKLKSSIKDRYRFGDIIGKSPSMQEVYELIIQAGASEAGVIIYGESGTGKELTAYAVHEMSSRSKNAFVPVNCGAIPETILEREFFGHKKGAFTGADTDIHGYLDLADKGTLFLDEVGELALNMQVKLLRALDKGSYLPVGSNKSKCSDFHVIAATNKNLKDQVNKGLMREDFFYRIHVIPIYMPSLRERREDIPLLIDHFFEKYDQENLPPITGNILESMYNYQWPGNIRELHNILSRYVTLKRFDFLEITNAEAVNTGEDTGSDSYGPELRASLARFEKQHILRILEQNLWHRGKTAAMLNIPPRTLYSKMKKYRLI
ncbi:sigma 54-interacting transcriptional regulator [Desulfobacterales bacterium HSG17]|nr:sigma 54-interacting transcriptional regulator [Desulfobacterales bacterium HSG17]